MKVYDIELEVTSIKTVRVTVGHHENHFAAINKAMDSERLFAAVRKVEWNDFNLVKEYVDE